MKDLTDPTNVDSVPAMLTKGEFVLNKEATAMFGPVIKRMNNAGLQQRAAENQAALNAGGYAQYNVGGLVSFLKREEGFEDKAYQDSGGKWTIGYGRTFNSDGSPVKAGQTTTRKAEDSWLSERAQSDYDATKKHLDANGIEYTDNQLQALASFRYNGGHGMLSSLTDNGSRNINEIYSMLPAYNKVTKDGKKVEVEGLTNRRAAEMALWGGEEMTMKPKPRPTQGDSSVPPTADAIADAAPPPSVIDDLVSTAISEYSIPSVQMHVPQMMGGQTMPDYIPSVTEKTMKQRQELGHFNEGGFVDWLFNRGTTKKQPTRNLDYPAIPPIATYDPMVGLASYSRSRSVCAG
jgi:GH24 family phage-related lysozyme (muramidase)